MMLSYSVCSCGDEISATNNELQLPLMCWYSIGYLMLPAIILCGILKIPTLYTTVGAATATAVGRVTKMKYNIN